MNNIYISYIVPCYNVANYLPRCIESLERQHIEGHDVEFILVNDGSKDETLSLIKQFANRDKRVVVIDQENQGVSQARNNALALARGQYVFFLDGDDYMTDDASQVMFDASNDLCPDVVLLNNYKVYEGHPDSPEMWVDYAKYIEAGTYKKNDFLAKTKRIPVSSKLYRLKFLRENEIVFDKHLMVGEVHTFFIHCLTLADKIGVCHTPVMYYLKRKSESATSSMNVERDLKILDTLHTICGYVKENDSSLSNYRAFREPVFHLVTAFFFIKYTTRTNYTEQIGYLIDNIKKDKYYQNFLRYFTGSGFNLGMDSLLAFAIRFLPARVAYNIARIYCNSVARGG